MDSQEKKAVKDDVRLYASLEAVAKMEGGKLLIKSLKRDLISSIDEITQKAKLPGTDLELRSAALRLGERLALYRTLTSSSVNKALAVRELDRILEDEPDELEEDSK